MKIACNREHLLTAFQTVAAVVPSRSPKPILQNIKLEVDQEHATLLATDLEQAIRLKVTGIEIEVPGAAILPLQRFGSILRETSDKTLNLEADPQGTIITGHHSEFRLPAKNPDEFPTIPQFEEEDYYEISAPLFREMIHRTVFAVDPESSRYALGGVLFEVGSEKIAAISTDGRRLAKMEGPAATIGHPVSSESTIIIPGRAMQLMERALSDSDTEVRMSARSSDVLVQTQRATIHSRLLEGRFPRWRDVFPVREKVVRIEVLVGPLYSAARQAAIITSEESRGIDFTFREGSLVLAGQTAEVGQARVELPIAYEGSEIVVMLDPRFLIDFLRVLDSEKTFLLELTDAESALVCTTDDGYGYVIMPLSRERAKA